VESSDSYLELPPLHFTPKSRREWRFPTSPIKFNRSLGFKLWDRIKKSVYKEDFIGLVYDDLEDLKEPERSNLHSFLVNVWSYQEGTQKRNRDFPIEIIIERSLCEGPEFAEYIHKAKSSLIAIREGRTFLGDFVPLKLNRPKFRNIGDIYRADFLFEWTPPHPDMLESILKPVEQDLETVECFREALVDWLNEPDRQFFRPIENQYVGCKDNTQKCITGYQWKEPLSIPDHFRGPSENIYVPNRLHEARMATLETSASLARILWIEYNVASLLLTDPRSIQDEKPDVLTKKLQRLITHGRKGSYGVRMKRGDPPRSSYCRDFDKEGLTKPHNIIKIMLEELHKRWPEAKAFEATHFFDKWEVLVDGCLITAVRGHGLGMGNSLTTLMQLIIERLVIDRSNIAPVWGGYNNDDAAVIFDSEADAKLYSKHDRDICDELGLAFKEKSSFICTGHVVLCECYGSVSEISGKRTFGYMSLARIMTAINASHARSMTSCMNISSTDRNFSNQVLKYWGPVLYRNEFTKTKCLGGWFRNVQHGIDMSYSGLISTSPLNQMEQSAYLTYRKVKLERTPWKKIEHSTKRSLYLPEEWLRDRGEKTIQTEQELFRPMMNVDENVRSWKKFHELIKKQFARECKNYAESIALSVEFIYKRECDESPSKDFYPPIGEYNLLDDNIEITCKGNLELNHPYSIPNQEVDLFLWQKDINLISYPRKMGIVDKISLSQRFFDPRTLEIDEYQRRGTILSTYGEYIVPSEKIFPYWHNPFVLNKCFQSEGYCSDFSIKPLYMSSKKKELLSLRKDYYSGVITPEEWIMIGQLKPVDQFLVSITSWQWQLDKTLGGNLLEKLTKVLKKFPGAGNFIRTIKNPNNIDEICNLIEDWSLSSWRFQEERKEFSRLRSEEKRNLLLEKTEEERKIASEFFRNQFGYSYEDDDVGDEELMDDFFIEDEIEKGDRQKLGDHSSVTTLEKDSSECDVKEAWEDFQSFGRDNDFDADFEDIHPLLDEYHENIDSLYDEEEYYDNLSPDINSGEDETYQSD
jgi:hypothetical protein